MEEKKNTKRCVRVRKGTTRRDLARDEEVGRYEKKKVMNKEKEKQNMNEI